MTSTEKPEHYCTLFDSNFLPAALCLHASLTRHARPFRLWVICMDEAVERQLQTLALSDVHIIPLREAENSELLGVKSSRSRGEYCWTLTPFTFTAVFQREPSLDRVTYLDADLFFFKDPLPLFAEFQAGGKHVLITEHAYAPEYDQTRTSGRFCVQFLTCRNTGQGRRVIQWWQERCIEWCFNRCEDGKFGDQKYLDRWPALFPDAIHVLEKKDEALAPWNADFFLEKSGFRKPVFFHFHNLRILSGAEVLLCTGYRLGHAAEKLYDDYVAELKTAQNVLKRSGIPWACLPQTGLRARLKAAKNILSGRHRVARLSWSK